MPLQEKAGTVEPVVPISQAKDLAAVRSRVQAYFRDRSSDWLNRQEADPSLVDANERVSELLYQSSRDLPEAIAQNMVHRKHAPFLMMAMVDAIDLRASLDTLGEELDPEAKAYMQKNAKNGELLFTEGAKSLLQGSFAKPNVDRPGFELRRIAEKFEEMKEFRQLGIMRSLIMDISTNADGLVKNDPADLLRHVHLIRQEMGFLLDTDSVYVSLADPRFPEERKKAIETDAYKVTQIFFALSQLESQLAIRVQVHAIQAEDVSKTNDLREKIFGREQVDRPQAWLDLKREAAYEQQIAESAARTKRWDDTAEYLYHVLWFGMSMRDRRIKEKFERALTKEDFKHIVGKPIHSASATQVAGKEIKRLVFVVKDPQVYDKLVSVFGIDEGVSHGVFIPGGMFDYMPPWHETGALFSQADPEIIDHEIRHSIDPYAQGRHQRTGKDRILNELFADFQRKIADGKNQWSAMEAFLNQYSTHHVGEGDALVQKDYRDTVGFVVKKAKVLQASFGDVALQRQLAQSKTIADFMRLS